MFIDSKMNGYGTKKNKNSYYEGDFKQGMRHGRGIFKKKNNIYEGIWENDELKTKIPSSKFIDELKELREEYGLQLLFNGRIAPETKIDLELPLDKFNFDKIKFELEMTKKENFFLKYLNRVFKLRSKL